MSLTVGAEFAGYGGAELGLSQVLDLEPLWFVEFDEAPSRVLAHHWPDAPNYGDSYCPVCGEPIDYCLGHGPIADPDSLALLPTRRVGAVTA